jgi:hypothetical protein
MDKNLFNKIWSTVDKENITVHFIIENEEHYPEAEELTEKLNIEKYTIFPFYTGEI